MSLPLALDHASGGVSCLAPAKLNLSLRVCGRRKDGYHLLSSLVCFADWGDRLTFNKSATDEIICDGRFAKILDEAGGDTLIAKSRDALREAGLIPNEPVKIHITKDIPLGAGLGGGSADAAATLKGLLALFQSEASPAECTDIGLNLGADVPVCLMGGIVLMEGIGEALTVLDQHVSTEDLPWLVLSHPAIHADTKKVFQHFGQSEKSQLLKNGNRPYLDRSHVRKALEKADWSALVNEGNDLIAPACQAYPDIAAFQQFFYHHTQKAIAKSMSGSGASFFGLFEHQSDALAAQHAIEKAGYWAQACPILIK